MDTGDSQAHYSECTNISQASDSVPSSTLKNKVRAPPLPPPSPLLCPRRVFLASLILASKFLQDRCYSNRAWAKLSGLPLREIGRSKRALGDALQWRLWVGKRTSQSPASNGREVVRCRSEGDLYPTSNTCPAPERKAQGQLEPPGSALLHNNRTLSLFIYVLLICFSTAVVAAPASLHCY